MDMETRTVRVVVNGTAYEREVEPRRMLGDFLRHDLELTGTHYRLRATAYAGPAPY
jgi:Aerobic-type carbon monoxide dehydrogenase, small subunit CoxS/CutS homologs